MNTSHRKFLLYGYSDRKYTKTDLPCRVRLDGSSSKQRSPFASEDVLIGLEHLYRPSTVRIIEWQPAFGMNELRSEHLVFAGNGMSGVACVEELLKSGQVFDITIFGDEPHTNYDRVAAG